jgi:ligand-binding sensor domain-containing protein
VWLPEGASLWRYDGASWADVSHPEGEVFLLAADPGGGMWAVNQTSLLRYLGGAWQTAGALGDIEGFFGASDLLVDTQGTLWMASAVPYIDGGGVYRWDGSGWTAYTEADGMAGNATGDLALAPDGQLWAAHSVRGLSRFDGRSDSGGAWHIEVADPRALGLEADGFNSITFAGDRSANGDAWFRLESHCGFEGTCYAGLAHKSGDEWTAYHVQPGGLPTEFVTAIAIDSAGGVWLGSDLGIVEMPPGG